MRKLSMALLAILAISLSACGCPAAKQSAEEVENSNNLIAPKFEAYVKADPNIAGPKKQGESDAAYEARKIKERDDWMKLSEKNKKNIKALKDALKD
jgi:hypothetical protein